MIERQAAGLKGILEELPSREASQFRLQESHQGFDKIMNAYDQACEKLVSLEKNTQGDIVAKLEERTLRARKLTERVLKFFIATGKDEVFSLIQALNILVENIFDSNLTGVMLKCI
ncbi:uncharacterized protein LOC111275995 isoform X1 [Durio zibethinus]|uniref:Uncharacterized protein LOC111275995 isoform X1 n=1 Tax=Durio zibethinus TaxID=66656 RepID=A0A6P5WN75_DURZI|nr:uncharacterized protein LOC111275995 isoform X1 [Durio zibethinus]